MDVANGLGDLVGVTRCLSCAARRAPCLCPPCARRMRPAGPPPSVPGASVVLGAFAYEGPARDLILALKVSGRRDAAGPLATGAAAVGRAHPVAARVVTWVPTRRHDEAVRGHDHAAVLARAIGRELGLPSRRLLRRTGARPDQSGLNREERRRNARGAFRAKGCSGTVLLVDDLITTGATAGACVGALKTAGAREVEVLAACVASR